MVDVEFPILITDHPLICHLKKLSLHLATVAIILVSGFMGAREQLATIPVFGFSDSMCQL